jgi:hypothetical protein
MSTPNINENVLPRLNQLQMTGLLVGAVGLVALVAGFFLDGTSEAGHALHAWQSFHIAFIFWNGVSTGMLGLLMLHHMVGGEWGFVNRRLLEAGAMTSIVMAVFAAIEVALGMRALYVWTHETDAIIAQKAPYLNAPFFAGRMVFYFLFFIGMAWILNSWSRSVDATGSPSFRTRARYLSGPGLVAYFLIYTFYIVDVIMSLDPHWMSTIFGLLLAMGAGLSALSVLAIAMRYLRVVEPLQLVFTRERFWDIGNLMLAFTMLWAYMSFSQYLIGWSGNLPEEAAWYVHRTEHGLGVVAIVLVVFHFFVPFFLLLQRRAKKSFTALPLLAAFVILMRHVDLWWLVKPNYAGSPSASFWWTDIAATVGIGGIWIAAFAFFLKTKPIVPVWETHHDRLPTKYEVYSHG